MTITHWETRNTKPIFFEVKHFMFVELILASINKARTQLLHYHKRNPRMSCFSINRGKRGKDRPVPLVSTKTTFSSKLHANHQFLIMLIFYSRDQTHTTINSTFITS
jgi:hypothetical protein